MQFSELKALHACIFLSWQCPQYFVWTCPLSIIEQNKFSFDISSSITLPCPEQTNHFSIWTEQSHIHRPSSLMKQLWQFSSFKGWGEEEVLHLVSKWIHPVSKVTPRWKKSRRKIPASIVQAIPFRSVERVGRCPKAILAFGTQPPPHHRLPHRWTKVLDSFYIFFHTLCILISKISNLHCQNINQMNTQ